MKKRLVSAITASGNLTIGNYLGAIKNFVKLQEKYELYIFVADLHALASDISKAELINNRKNIFALYLACGIDPELTTLFFQSDVAAHSQMAWIMESMTTIGELQRMTQFKDKAMIQKEANHTTKIKTTLLTYPTLMAGDILLYNPDAVPVGSDQKQHLELTKKIAKRFNNYYGQIFKIPDFQPPKIVAKIMALQNPAQKMSKSDNNHKNAIFLLEDPKQAFNKIKKAVTDSEGKIYVSDHKPGITNLLSIYAGLNEISLEQAVVHFENKNYGQLKEEIGQQVQNLLQNIQLNYHQFMKKVDAYAELGAQKARVIANDHLDKIYKKIGLKSIF